MAGIFKAYDIRGVYPEELNEEIAYRIGYAAASYLKPRELAVGRDMRLSAEAIQSATVRGIRDAGADVVDIGLVATPMSYFAAGRYGFGGAVMVTASHNPSEYIGYKLCREEAVPMAYETGIMQIEERVAEGALKPSAEKGDLREQNIWEEYRDHILSFARDIKPLKIVVDAANGMGGKVVPYLFEKLPCEVIPLYFALDGRFPNHEANPLERENLVDLVAKVKETGAALGVAYDGDADRVAFLDERADVVSCDMITALLAQETLAHEKGAAIIYDLRSSRVVPEEIERLGGRPIESRVGHSYMKAKMREVNGAFGGELSGHYYFRDNFYADSADITLLKILNLLSSSGKPMSELVRPLLRYWATGEVNFEVEDKAGKMREIAEAFSDGEVSHLDGVTVRYNDWWCNVRPSNTEPLLRLNLEADTREKRDEARKRVEEVLKK